MEINEKSKEYECKKCKKTFHLKLQMQKHISVHDTVTFSILTKDVLMQLLGVCFSTKSQVNA